MEAVCCAASAGRSIAQLSQRRALVQGDVAGLVALDLVLRVVRAGVVRIPLVVDVGVVHFDDRTTNTPNHENPAHVVTDFVSLHANSFAAHERPHVAGTYDNFPFSMRAAEVLGCSSVLRASRMWHSRYPAALRQSAISARWQRHHTASEHITAVLLCRASSARRATAARKSGVSMFL